MKRITRKQLKTLIETQHYPDFVRIVIGDGYAYASPTCQLSRGGLVYKVRRWVTVSTKQATVFLGPLSLVVMPHEKA